MRGAGGYPNRVYGCLFRTGLADSGLMSFSSFLLICYGVRFPQRDGSPSRHGGAMPHNSGVVCLNCGAAMRPKMGRRPEVRTTDTIPLLLACPSCGHVHEYKLPRFFPGLRFSACECSDSNCKFPVAVYTVLPAGIDAEAELAIRRAQWIFHSATCPFGHPLGTQQR